MRERRRRECDREGRSSIFRRKMRPRSGMHGPVIHKCGRRIPCAGRSRFAGPSPSASGRDREGRSSTFRRKMRPRSGMHGPVIHKCGRRIPYAVDPLALRFESRPRRIEQYFPKEDAIPVAATQRTISAAAASPARVDPASRVPWATLWRVTALHSLLS